MRFVFILLCLLLPGANADELKFGPFAIRWPDGYSVAGDTAAAFQQYRPMLDTIRWTK